LVDYAEAEVALKMGDLRRAEAIAVQASRHIGAGHALRSKTLWLAGTSAHLTWRDRAALDYFVEAQECSVSDVDGLQALWGRFIATEALELEQEAQTLLQDFVAHASNSIDDRLRIATGHFRMASLSGGVREVLDTHLADALLAERASDPLIRTSFLNTYAGLLVLAGRYDEAAAIAQGCLLFAEKYSLGLVIPLAHLHLAEAKWGVRDFRGCRASIADAERTGGMSESEFLMSCLGVLRARTLLTTGSVSNAMVALDRCHRWAATCFMHAEYLGWWSLMHALAADNKRAQDCGLRAEGMSGRVEVTGPVAWARAIVATNRGQKKLDPIIAAIRSTLDSGNIDAFVTTYRSMPSLLQSVMHTDEVRDELRVILDRAKDFRIGESLGLRTRL
jgi:hypothetical protein